MSTTIRRLVARDLDFALEQTAREGWTSSRAWFEVLLHHDPAGSFVAELEGQPVALVTSTRLAATGWIGNLITLPDHRARGIGTQLMAIALGHLSGTGARTVRLEADPPGVRIYRKLGFTDEFESRRFHLDVPANAAGPDLQPLDAADLPRAAAFDRNAFGDDRGRLLNLLHARADTSLLVQHRDCIAGYGFLVGTTTGLQLGPLVATGVGAAEQLVDAAVGRAAGRRLTVGIPAVNVAGCALLRARGFVETAPSLRMARPAPVCGGTPAHVFGIVNGAVG